MQKKIEIELSDKSMDVKDFNGLLAGQMTILRDLQRSYIGQKSADESKAYAKAELEKRINFTGNASQETKNKALDYLTLDVVSKALGNKGLYAEGGETDEDEQDENVDRLQELSDEYDIPTEVIKEYANDRGIEISEIDDLPFNGRFDSEEDYAEDMVEQGAISNLSYYLEMYPTDMRIFAQEEADSRVDNMDDDELLYQADTETEADEYDSIQDEISDLKEEINDLQDDIDEIYANEDEDVTESESEENDAKADDLKAEKDAKERELEDLEDRFASMDSRDELIEKAREDLREQYYDEIYEALEKDAVGYFVDELGYSAEDLVKNSSFTIDYTFLAKELGYDVLYIEHNGDVYVFSNYERGGMTYAKGGNIPTIEKRVAEVNKLIAEGNDKGLEVVDESTTWQSPMKYNPLKYSNGVLYVSYEQLDLYNYNKGRGEGYKKESYKVGKNEMGMGLSEGSAQKETLTDIARMYRKAINSFNKYGYADGGMMAKGGGTEIGGNYTIKNDLGSFTSVKVMAIDSNYKPSKSHFSVQVSVRKKDGDKEIIQQKPIKTYPIESYDDFLNDLIKRGAKKMADGGMMASGGIIATSPSLEGIKKIISNYYYSSNISLKKNEDSDEYEVHNAKGKINSVKVIEKKGRFQFVNKMADGGMMAKGGGIPNNYRGKTSENIWNELTENQRVHFMIDHAEEIGLTSNMIPKYAEKGWSDLNEKLQDAFAVHTMMGQYADGGGVDNYQLTETEDGNTEVRVGNFTFYFDGVGDMARLKEIYHRPTDIDASFDTRYKPNLSQFKRPSQKLIVLFKHPILGEFQVRGGFQILKERPTYVDGSMYEKGGRLKVGDTIYRAWFTDDDGEKGSAIIVAESERDAEEIAKKINDRFSYLSNPIKIKNEEVLYEESREKEPIYKMAEGGTTDGKTLQKVKVTIKDVDMGGDVVYKGDHWFKKDQLANKTNEQIGDFILKKYGLDYGNTYKYSIVKTKEEKQMMARGGKTDDNYRGKKEQIIKELRKIKSGVGGKPPYVFEKDGFIYVSAEEGDNYADYYRYYINKDLIKVANKYGTFWEWEDAGSIMFAPEWNWDMAKGGITFDEKVESISESLMERKKVSPKVQKDYGKTYNKKEAVASAKRIAGAMRSKENAKKKS
jgi:hypothetical protein